jgi:tetratricopeptide (TPR) repeat protein
MPDRQNEALKLQLSRAQWTPEVFARQLNSFARELGRIDYLDLKTPYKWLRGSTPRAPWPAFTAALLSRELGEPITPKDLGWQGDNSLLVLPANAGLVVPWTVDGTLSTAKQVSETNPMDRRSFLLLVGAALTSPAHEWLIARPVTDASRNAGRLITSELADHLNIVTDQLRRMDDQGGGRSLLDLVRAQTDYVVKLLQASRYTDSTGRQLHTTVAELLRLAGWLAFDSGRHTEAQRFFIAALHGAHSAGDRQLGANVLGFMSCQAKDLGKYDEAIKLADTAIAGYKGTSPRVSAILHMRAAQAYANAGDATESRRSIESAYSFFNDRTTGNSEPDWCYWLDEAQINEQIGYCFLKLKDWARASNHMRTAVRLQENSYSREGALRFALLADTHAQQGEPERACELGTRALETLASHVDSARCVGHVQSLREHLRPYRRAPAVRDFSARVDQLSAGHGT